ncbi:MAG: PQQ-dependent sugar dehydrogenase [Bacteroidota bacterium]
MAFHPDYKTNGFFFVYYTNAEGNVEVARYKRGNNPNIADPSSKTVVITIAHPVNTNHNGGKLNFGPDGYLYFGTGDGGSAGDPPKNAQNGKSLLGKMLRLDVNNFTAPAAYSIPPDNPFISDTTIADEVWSMGLRNPWRWSFDRATHDMWIGDVGQNAWEEINFSKANENRGLNYGWRCYEGTHAYNIAGCQATVNYVPPVFDYTHNNATGGFCVTGGFVYRGPDYPSLNGYYIFADYVSGNQWTITPGNDSAWRITKQTGTYPAGISSFGEAENGTLYAASLAGTVYKIEAITSVQFQLTSFTGSAINGVTELNWATSSENNLSQFEIEYSIDSVTFQKKGTVQAANKATGSSYKFDDVVSAPGKVFYRLKIIGSDGKWDYSKTITVLVSPRKANAVYPSIITNGVISLFIPDPYNSLEIFSMNGALMLRKDIKGTTGRIDIAVPVLAKGIYLIKLMSSKNTVVQKIFIR